jgi:hypothetical protein
MLGRANSKSMLLVRRAALLFFLMPALPSYAAASTHDALTGLPLYPGLKYPSVLPKAMVCKSMMKGDFYIALGNKINAVNEWYVAHLAGFHMYHAVTDGRTQDTFFNSDGTKEVTITGSRSDADEVFSISYGEFRPGLSQNASASFHKPTRICD